MTSSHDPVDLPTPVARTQQRVSVLTIAGSDSGGGAGIQADLRAFAARGVHGTSALTALTAQNTQGVSAIHLVPTAFLRAQIESALADFDIRAIKVGMLATAEIAAEVASILRENPQISLVLDPVMIASSGARLLDPEAVAVLRSDLLPRASVLTPNLPEAHFLLGEPFRDATPEQLIAGLLELGPAAVLLKGGHAAGDTLIDRLALADGTVTNFEHRRLPLEGHGTGCTLASALAAGIALGEPLELATARACELVHRGLLRSYAPGRGELHVLDLS